MPGNPKGGCQFCKAIATAAEKVKVNFKLYAFLALIFIELFSLKMQNYVSVQDYAYKYYPLMANLEFAILFTAIYFHTEKLRFCTRQKLIVLALIAYFVINALFIVVPICWNDYSTLTNYFILSVILILFVITWRNI